MPSCAPWWETPPRDRPVRELHAEIARLLAALQEAVEATNDGAALEVFRAATVPAALLQPAHDFATVRQPQPILWRDSDEVSRGTNNAVLSVGEVALPGVRRRTRQEYRRAGSDERRRKSSR